jgi:hypothetical protein
MLRYSGSNFKAELVLRLLGLAHARDTMLGNAMVCSPYMPDCSSLALLFCTAVADILPNGVLSFSSMLCFTKSCSDGGQAYDQVITHGYLHMHVSGLYACRCVV